MPNWVQAQIRFAQPGGLSDEIKEVFSHNSEEHPRKSLYENHWRTRGDELEFHGYYASLREIPHLRDWISEHGIREEGWLVYSEKPGPDSPERLVLSGKFAWAAPPPSYIVELVMTSMREAMQTYVVAECVHSDWQEGDRSQAYYQWAVDLDQELDEEVHCEYTYESCWQYYDLGVDEWLDEQVECIKEAWAEAEQ